FICLESLPLNANGKIDLAALPLPQRSNILREKVAAEPGTPLEQRVAGILAKLLSLDQVNPNDNFFFLGGHSLLGTQLITRVRDVFGVDLSLKSLFDHPTVAQLSQEIEKLLVAKLNAMTEKEAEERLKFLMERREEA
ncbi:MAG: phosphopantetheine-binding protein, partial [Candidatus Acidiferrales bacterium]